MNIFMNLKNITIDIPTRMNIIIIFIHGKILKWIQFITLIYMLMIKPNIHICTLLIYTIGTHINNKFLLIKSNFLLLTAVFSQAENQTRMKKTGVSDYTIIMMQPEQPSIA